MIAPPTGGAPVSKVHDDLYDEVVSVRPIHRRKPVTSLRLPRLPHSIPVQGITRPIQVKFASTASEWEQAFRLAASSYQARGYESPGANHLRFTPYHALPETVTLVALHEEEVVATFSVVQDNALLGLPMEDVYAKEIHALRQSGRRLAETTTLADNGLSLREFIQVFLALIKLAMQHHRSQGGDTPVIAVNPRHRQFYTKMLGFVSLGPLRSYAAVQDHPAEAFWVDYELMSDKVPKMYTEIFGEPVPPEALCAPRMPSSLMRRFAAQSSLCTVEEVEKILALTRKVDRIG